MFVVMGICNIGVSFWVYCLPSAPNEARFLSEYEKEVVERIVRMDHSGTGPKVFRTRSLFEVLLDLQTWILSIIVILTTMTAGIVVYFSSAIIRTFGFSSKEAALLNMPAGVVSIIATLYVSFIVANGYARWIGMALASATATLGVCLLFFLPPSNKAGLLGGLYLINVVGLTALSLSEMRLTV